MNKNKGRVSIDRTTRRLIGKIRRIVKRLRQKDIPKHKAQGDPWEQTNSLKNQFRKSVIQLRCPPARNEEAHQMHS